jgi:hypothetical protein
MRLFIDCEWNGFQGELISISLVPEDDLFGPFYAELQYFEPTDPWVREYVVPHLNGSQLDIETFKTGLEAFLNQFATVHIVADWPEDIAWFCTCLITGPGTRLNTPPLTTEILRVDTESFIPHNALYDAIALKNHVIKERL